MYTLVLSSENYNYNVDYPSSKGIMQLNELAEFHKNCLKKLPYRSYLYHIPRRIRPVRRLSAHLCRNGRRVGVEKLFFKSFIWMMR